MNEMMKHSELIANLKRHRKMVRLPVYVCIPILLLSISLWPEFEETQITYLVAAWATLMLPLVVMFIWIWKTFQRPGLTCPKCGIHLAYNAGSVIATGHCAKCGNKLIEENGEQPLSPR